MGLFSGIFQIFKKNNAQTELLDAYKSLHALTSVLAQELRALREIQNTLVNQNISYTNYSNHPTGGIGREKANFIEEKIVLLKRYDLIRQLSKLSAETRLRFKLAEEKLCSSQPISEIEKIEMRKIINLVHQMLSYIPAIEDIANHSTKGKLDLIDTVFREIRNLAKEFHDAELRKEEMIREITSREISPLLRKIYYEPEEIIINNNRIYKYDLGQKQLSLLINESRKIMASGDKRYLLFFREWWRDKQLPTQDATTSLKEPHVNVIIKFPGGPKKNIHLVVH